MIQTPSVLPTVIVGVVVVVVLAGVLAVIVLAGQTKGVHFVISDSLDTPVTRSPIEGAVHNRWPIDYRAPAREVPEDISGSSVKRVHLSGIRACVHDAICNGDRARID